MIEASAVVERVEGGRAWVRLRERSGGCGRCDEPGGCRSAGIAYALKSPNEIFSLPNAIGVEAGDAVLLRMHDGAPLRGALLGYGLASSLLVVGAGIGNAVASGGREDLFALMGAGIGLVCSMVFNRLVLRSRAVRGGFEIEMARVGAQCHAPEGLRA
ncbi:SoxR reducing system RseC family protein [Aromatoleum diolicum]|uniref:Fis family transcriptional regulator n=1 Tax=Aromatoleum diolicum TaxID=75796 RepID=A0ABX1Q7Q5_9RHOO|nr:SoxR reducing system RseC family protein [Aromatoleum diolicum]NMG74038.1 Fis family transcriptional regulator [Aromatoleum diolicum]